MKCEIMINNISLFKGNLALRVITLYFLLQNTAGMSAEMIKELRAQRREAQMARRRAQVSVANMFIIK